MKKLLFLMSLLFALTVINAQEHIKADLKVVQIEDAKFTTDLFQIVCYGGVQLAGKNPIDSTRWIASGFDIVFTFWGDKNNASKIMAYCGIGSKCVATLKIFDNSYNVNCYITEVKNTEAMIIVSTRANSKLVDTEHK